MKLEVARPEQSAELAAFFKKFPIHGPVEILVDRSRDFFSPYQIQSDSSLTYALRADDTNELLGVASFVILDTQLGGQPTRVAYGRDLRILNTRQAVLGWTRHFLPVMEEIERVFGAQAFISALNLAESQATNAFLRPRPGKRPLPRYYLYRRFNLVSLHGKFPWAPGPLKSIRIRRASERTEDALLAYIVRQSKERDLATGLTLEALRDQLSRWPGLQIGDFLIAMDANENIIGCCAPWNPGGIEEYIPLKYNLLGHNFRQFLKFGRRLGWTRTLTKPLHRLGYEASLDFKYLSFLFANNADIFESLAWIAYEEARDTEFLVYSQMRSDFHLRRPATWISARMPQALYMLVPPNREAPSALHPSNDRAALIEPFFV